MYHDILIQRCNLERQVLQNALSIARKSPDEFAYNIMKGPGYMALLAGEVAHIIKCIPVDVKLIQTEECYDQLPVHLGNATFYFSPRTHILTKLGIQISCNRLVPPMYMLDGAWYSLGPNPVRAIPPSVIKPLSAPTWQYQNPHNLATSGIYTQQDLDELRDHIMFPAERPAILNSVARGISGQPTVTQGGSISNLLDENSIKKIIQSTWDKTWGYLAVFGNISAGLIGILLICRLIKFIFDTVIHGYALHTIYGWSIYLIGAIWDSVTYLLLHLNKRSGNPKSPGQTDSGTTNVPKEGKSKGSEGFPYGKIGFEFDPRVRALTETQYPDVNTNEPKNPIYPFPEDCVPPQYNPHFIKNQLTRPVSFVWATPSPVPKNASTAPKIPEEDESKPNSSNAPSQAYPNLEMEKIHPITDPSKKYGTNPV